MKIDTEVENTKSKVSEKVTSERSRSTNSLIKITEFVKNKIRSFAHTELNNSRVLDNIDVESMMNRGVGFNPQDPRPFVRVKLDDYFPAEVLNNQSRYSDYIVEADVLATDYLPKTE